MEDLLLKIYIALCKSYSREDAKKIMNALLDLL